MASKTTIAVIPGTGKMGFGLARLFAKSGHRVLLGSREASSAQTAANKIKAEFPSADVKAGKSEELPVSQVRIQYGISDLDKADVIVWCPYLRVGFEEAASYLKTFNFSGKIVLDITNATLLFSMLSNPDQISSLLGKISSTEKNIEVIPSARWVAGFKIVGAADLLSDKPAYGANLYSDDKEALEIVKNLVEGANFPVAKTGPLVGGREDEVFLWDWLQKNGIVTKEERDGKTFYSFKPQ